MDLAAIQRALARIYTDSAFRECFLARPLAAGQALGLTAEEAEWLAQLPPGQVRFFARALQRKRLGQVARLLPLTCRSLGGEFERLFLHYADTASPGGARNCRDDAIAFVASLQEHSITGRLTPPWAADLARYEATWLQAARSATQCLAGSFRYPVGPLIRSLIAGQEEPHLPAQATLALWIRFSRNGRLHHEVLPLGRPRPASPCS
jgi:hypothetical protein